MPNNGNNSGSVFNIRNEPFGLKGASMLSQARHKKIKVTRLEPAPILSAGNIRKAFPRD